MLLFTTDTLNVIIAMSFYIFNICSLYYILIMMIMQYLLLDELSDITL